MRCPASEKVEIIKLVEQSHLPTRRTLDKLGIPRRTLYRWYNRYLAGVPEAHEDRSPRPSRVWNRILLENYSLPGDLRYQIDVFVDHYNRRRYHKSLQNLTPADVYSGRGQTVLKRRKRSNRKTIETRRLLQRKSTA